MPHVLYNGQKKIRDSYNFSQEWDKADII
jgi:hypothetical protein